jgi:hypothetical protein
LNPIRVITVPDERLNKLQNDPSQKIVPTTVEIVDIADWEKAPVKEKVWEINSG